MASPFEVAFALGQPFSFTVPDDMTVERLFSEALGLPPAEVAIALVNGVHSDRQRRLSEGDTVSLWPPIAGGAV